MWRLWAASSRGTAIVAGRSTRSLGINMPLWAAGYFGLYLALSGWSLVDDFRSKESKQRMVIEFAADVLLLVPALSFWWPEIGPPFVLILGPAFFLGVLLLAWVIFVGFRKHIASDPELSPREKLGVGIATLGLVLAISAPLVYWAFRAAILGEHVDT